MDKNEGLCIYTYLDLVVSINLANIFIDLKKKYIRVS